MPDVATVLHRNDAWGCDWTEHTCTGQIGKECVEAPLETMQRHGTKQMTNKQERHTKRQQDLHAQCMHAHAAILLLCPVSILPDGVTELRALHDNLTDRNARSRLDRLDNTMDSCIKAKYQARVVAIEHEVASGK